MEYKLQMPGGLVDAPNELFARQIGTFALHYSIEALPKYQ